MSKKYKIQAVILISIGILLAPALFISVWVLVLSSITSSNPGGDSNLALSSYLVVFAPLAFISLLCFVFGVRRLTYAKNLQSGLFAKEYSKSGLSALAIGTTLLAIIGATMLAYVAYTLLKGDTYQIVLTGAIPILVILLAIIIVPINMRKISRQKKTVSTHQATASSTKS